MFHAFELQPDVSAIRKRITVSLGAATLVLGASLVGVGALATARGPEELRPRQVDVSFRPPPPPPEPVKIEVQPPPPPKLARPRPPPPVVVAELLPPPRAAPAPAAAAMVAPKEVPKELAPESDVAVSAIALAVGGTGDGSGTAVGSNDADESAAPVIASAGTSGPVNLPEDAEPPEPSESNSQPEYPESARTTGQEAKVVLKLVVELDGSVGRVQVLKGEEPFVSAALAVVKTWKYEPATLEGVPLSVFKIVNITFSLRD